MRLPLQVRISIYSLPADVEGLSALRDPYISRKHPRHADAKKCRSQIYQNGVHQKSAPKNIPAETRNTYRNTYISNTVTTVECLIFDDPYTFRELQYYQPVAVIESSFSNDLNGGRKTQDPNAGTLGESSFSNASHTIRNRDPH